MANGDLLEEVMELVRDEKAISEISEKALARLTLVTQIQLFRRLDEILSRLLNLENEVRGLCTFREEQKKKEEETIKIKREDESEMRKFVRGAYLALGLVILDIVLHLAGVV